MDKTVLKEFENVSKVLESGMENTDIIVYFGDRMRRTVQEKLKSVKQIILVGATPFAKKVMTEKNCLEKAKL